MIVTLTPNPSLDFLFQADRLVWDDANRVAMPRRRPAGQGVNVVRALRVLDPAAAALAVVPLGGHAGDQLRAMLEEEGTPLHVVPVQGETRVFVGVRERSGRSLLLNPRGPELSPREGDALLSAVAARLDQEAAGPAWLVCCGSLPPGLEPDLYARASALARDRGHRVVPDCDGEPLRLAVAAGADLLVPNLHEASRLLGRTVDTGPSAERAARSLLDLGPATAIITLGAEGAVGADAAGSWRAVPVLTTELRTEMEGGSAVGAGDAFLAALLLALDAGAATPDALIDGVAAGTACLLSRGTDLLRTADVERVRPLVRVTRTDR